MESCLYIRFLKKRDSKNFKRWLAMFAAVKIIVSWQREIPDLALRLTAGF